MTIPICPKCRRVISSEDVNVVSDVAYCRPCNLAHRVSALLGSAELVEGVDFNDPPAGVSLRNDGGDAVVTASNRAFVGAIFSTFAAALFWNGIVSIFVLVALAGTLAHLGIALPECFPKPPETSQPISVGMTVFLWVFLTPFIAIGLWLIGCSLFYLLGRTEVRVGHSEGSVFTGIGMLGWRRRFDPTVVRDVRIDTQAWGGDGHVQHPIAIELRDGKRMKIGTMLTSQRRKFVAAWLSKTLLQPRG